MGTGWPGIGVAFLLLVVTAARADVCPPDSGSGDADQDNVCDNDDPCPDDTGTRTFLAQSRPRLRITGVNDGVSDNQHLSLRATFDIVAPSTPSAQYDPWVVPTIIRLTNASGTSLLSTLLARETYTGPGTRGWVVGRRWQFRDRTPDPVAGVVGVRISSLLRDDVDRVRVRVDVRSVAFGLPADLDPSALPLQLSVTMGPTFPPQTIRCGQTRFTAGDCSLAPGATKVLCRQ